MSNYIAVPADAIEWLKTHYPNLCVKAGLCETVGGRLYTRTSSEAPPPHKVLAEHSGCGRGAQWEQVSAKLYPGDKIVLIGGAMSAAPAAQAAHQHEWESFWSSAIGGPAFRCECGAVSRDGDDGHAAASAGKL